MAEEVQVELRQTRGTKNARRMRAAGKIPAVLYGHGQETISLAVAGDQLDAVVRHGSQVVDLRGVVNESAQLKQLQWDTWGADILHVDFSRVSADERIEVTVQIELRGEAPGTKDGGVVEHLLHELSIECAAMSIPDKIRVSVNALKLGDSLTVADLNIPEGVKVLTDAETPVVNCHEPVEEEELEAEPAGAAEPEVIGRAESEGDENEK